MLNVDSHRDKKLTVETSSRSLLSMNRGSRYRTEVRSHSINASKQSRQKAEIRRAKHQKRYYKEAVDGLNKFSSIREQCLRNQDIKFSYAITRPVMHALSTIEPLRKFYEKNFKPYEVPSEQEKKIACAKRKEATIKLFHKIIEQYCGDVDEAIIVPAIYDIIDRNFRFRIKEIDEDYEYNSKTKQTLMGDAQNIYQHFRECLAACEQERKLAREAMKGKCKIENLHKKPQISRFGAFFGMRGKANAKLDQRLAYIRLELGNIINKLLSGKKVYDMQAFNVLAMAFIIELQGLYKHAYAASDENTFLWKRFGRCGVYATKNLIVIELCAGDEMDSAIMNTFGEYLEFMDKVSTLHQLNEYADQSRYSSSKCLS